MTVLRILGALMATLALAAPAAALAGTGIAEPWQLGFQKAVSPSMEHIASFHNLVLVIIIVIALFVMALLGYCIFRFNSRANPTPSKTTHHTVLEVVWTAVPVLILVVIAVPSFKLLYFTDRAVDAEMTIKAIGNQWYWSYEYPDHGEITFDSIMTEEADLQPGQPRLLTTDTAVVLPVGTKVRVLVTATDVLHAWAVPALGVKMDAVPGRLNETWLQIDEPGIYYGQCSELCGIRHGFMPIMVRAVSRAEFDAWVAKTREAMAPAEHAPVRVAETRR